MFDLASHYVGWQVVAAARTASSFNKLALSLARILMAISDAEGSRHAKGGARLISIYFALMR